MAAYALAALNAETPWVPLDGYTMTVDVSGAFSGTVQFFYRATPNGVASPMAVDAFGTPALFSAASGTMRIVAPSSEPEAQVQARMVSFFSGAATVRIARAEPAADDPAVVTVVRPGALGVGTTFARAHTGSAVATFQNTAGVWQEAAANVPRFNGRLQRLLCEPAGSNLIRNPRCVGAVPGGALPTNWSVFADAGLTTTVVSTQVVDGVETVTLDVAGTPTSTVYLMELEPPTQIVTTPSSPFTYSMFMRLDSGDPGPDRYFLRVQARTAAGGGIALPDGAAQGFLVKPQSDLRRYSFVGSFGPDALIARAWVFLQISSLTVGVPYSARLTVGWPTYDNARAPRTPILPAAASTGTSVVGADVVTAPLPASLTGYTVQVAAAPSVTPTASDTFAVVQLDGGTDADRVAIRQGATAGTLRLERATAGAATDAALPGAVVGGQLVSAAVVVDGAGRVDAATRGQASATLTGAPAGPVALTTLRLGVGAAGQFQGEFDTVTVRARSSPVVTVPALANSVGPSFAGQPIRMTVLYGQSRAANRAGGTVIWPQTLAAAEPDLALVMRGPPSMFAIPFERAYEARWTTLFEPFRDKPLTEEETFITDVSGVDTPVRYVQLGQSMGSHMWRRIAYERAAGLPAQRHLFLVGGEGGRPISSLVKGAPPFVGAHGTFVIYDRLMAAITQANTIARDVYGVQLIVDAVCWAQGETDGQIGTAPAVYRATFEQFARDITNDIQAITGQARAPFLVTDLAAPLDSGTGVVTPISMAQEAAVLADNTGRLACIGPVYWHPYNSPNHMEQSGVVAWGERWALALHDLVHNGVYPTWLRRASLSVRNNVIEIQTAGAVGDLVIDTTTVPAAPNYGFNLAGTAATITGVSVLGNIITITCSANPTGGTLHYAGILAGGNAGGTTGFCGAYGNIRDSYGLASTLVPGAFLRRFLASFVTTL